MTLTPQKSYKGTLSSSFLSLWWCDMTRTWFWGSTLFCLCRTLEREELRKRYISPPVPVEGIPLVYPENGEPWIGRRIDYILYRESSISKHCQTVCAPVYFYCLLYSVHMQMFPELKHWRLTVRSYRKSYIKKHKESFKSTCSLCLLQEIEEMTFITQLAGLTDHIPVGLRLNVTLDSDRAEEWGLKTEHSVTFKQKNKIYKNVHFSDLQGHNNVFITYLNL